MKSRFTRIIISLICGLTLLVSGCSANNQQTANNSSADTSPAASQSETSKTLVVYFSCTGTTQTVAGYIAEAAGANIFEIVPETPYTSDDLDYSNEKSRSSAEQNDAACRPAISSRLENAADYDTIYLGYPIWWGNAPKIISTFLESYDFSGKTVIPFCTSGGSDISASVTALKPLAPKALWQEGKRFSSDTTEQQISEWVNTND